MRQISMTDTQSSWVCQTIISFLCEGEKKQTNKQIKQMSRQFKQINKSTSLNKYEELQRTGLVHVG